ncbi:MAG TPA: hypothetical protein VGF84_19405 [Micromonosporaceae bacterium]|jgi:hypothetical protein
MSLYPSTRTRSSAIGAAAIGVILALALAACSSSSTGGAGGLSAGSAGSAPASTGPSTGSGAPTVPATAPATPPASVAPSTHPYPSDYAGAILAAWKAHDTAYLTLLTNSTTATKLYGYGNINQVWTRSPGSGAAGHTYWQAYNQAGDWIVLRTPNLLPSQHQWHIGEVYTWDQMTFPNDPVQYVKRFVNGWLDGNVARMKLLSSTTLTTQIQGLSTQPEPGYFTVTDTGGAAGHSYVEVKDATVSFDITLQLVNANVGHHNAIESCYAGC